MCYESELNSVAAHVVWGVNVYTCTRPVRLYSPINDKYKKLEFSTKVGTI